MTLRRFALGAALAGVAAAACTTTPVVNATYNFDRATDVDFICLQISSAGGTSSTPLPLSACALSDTDNGAEGNTGTSDANAHLHALVTQSERGEMAVVDLATLSGVPLVDNSQSIPGYTFLPVGRLPSAIVVDNRAEPGTPPTPQDITLSTPAVPHHTAVVWVASAEDHVVQRLDATLVRQDARDVRNTLGQISVAGSPRDLAVDTVNMHQLLYVALPDQGAIQVFDVTDPINPIDRGLVHVSSPAGAPGADGGTDGGADGGMGGGLDGSPGALPGHPVALALAPEATATGGHRVYVADDSTPWVHVIAGDTLQEVDRLYVTVPTRGLVALPRVRANPLCPTGSNDHDHCDAARYLYVISANDGAVYGYDLERRVRVLANRLPDTAINPASGVRDFDPTLNDEFRVPIPFATAALTAIVTQDVTQPGTPGGPVPNVPCNNGPPFSSAAFVCPAVAGLNSGYAAPGQLNGVFLGVVLRNGNFAVIDVDDYDLNCRLNDCNAAGVAERCFFHQSRHTPRSALTFDHAPSVINPPVLTASVLGGTRTGVAVGPATPTIACTATRMTGAESCDPVVMGADRVDNTRGNFGIQLTPRIDPGSLPGQLPPMCPGQSDADVYTARNETWTLTYSGILPGLDILGGQFVANSDGLTLQAPGAGFCFRGTLGGNQEFVSIVDDPLPSSPADVDLCSRYFGGGTGPINRTLPVVSALQDTLTLGVPVLGATDPARGLDAAAVHRCFPQATRFQVRANNQWVVVGSRTGYVHAVVPDASGRCMVDPVAQATSDTRAQGCLRARLPAGATRPAMSCPEGRACNGAFNNGYSTVTTPVFANPYFCLQIYPGVDTTLSVLQPHAPDLDEQFTFTIANAYDPLVFTTGMLPASAHFVSSVGRLYVVDTAQNGLVEYRTNPLTRSRLFN